jgi:glycine/D-amino acid oxidase-like deaminating enzyme
MKNLEAGSIEPNGEPKVGSMAAEIYQELKDLVPLGANADPHGRSVHPVAFAKGVIQHLKERQAAFVPRGDVGSVALTNGSITIN